MSKLPSYQSLSFIFIGMVISISQQVYHQGDLMGVTGIDISLTDIAEDTSYFTNSDTLYSFLIDDSGKKFNMFFTLYV